MSQEISDPGDLTRVRFNSSGEISKYLLQRVREDQPYTAINSSSLVSLNPGKSLACYTDAAGEIYSDIGYKNFTERLEPLPPHIFGLVTRAYLHLRRMGKDQSFIFCGDMGSGKSENYSLVLNQLCRLAASPKHPSKIEEGLNNLNLILGAFGNAANPYNTHSTRYGRYQEVQFNPRGRIIGIKTLTYGLEKSRIHNVSTSERNFDLLYQVLYGVSSEERVRLSLPLQPNLHTFHYLADSNRNLVSIHDDKVNFNYLMEAMKGVGIRSKARSNIIQLVAVILHLGNLSFSKAYKQDNSIVTNSNLLRTVAELLGVHKDKLETSLTSKSQPIGRELCTVFLNEAQSNTTRDTLASTLYSLMFAWVVEAINSKFCQDEPANFIAMVDQFGFQSTEINYFERFCVNFVNERVHYYALDQLLSPNKGLRQELASDEFELPNQGLIQFNSVAKLLAGVEGDSSILEALNHYSKKPKSRLGEDMFRTYLSPFATNTNLTMDPNNNSFRINHYSATVEYTMNDFVTMNLDPISTDLVSLFRNVDGTSNSSNPFLAELFSSDDITLKTNHNNQDSTVSAQQASITRRKPSLGHRKFNFVEETKDPTVLSKLNTTLTEIFSALDATKVWTVINIATFEKLGPDARPEFNIELIQRQVDSFALLTLADQLVFDFTASFTFQEFLQRYELVIQLMHLDLNKPVKNQVDSVATILGWQTGLEYVLGTNKIFLSESRWRDMEDNLRTCLFHLKSSSSNGTPLPLEGTDGLKNDNASLYSELGETSNSRFQSFKSVGNLSYQSIHKVKTSIIPNSYTAQRSVQQLEPNDTSRALTGTMEMRSISPSVQPGRQKKTQQVGEVKITPARKSWVKITWMLTWMIPTLCISKCGMTRLDVQMAWREKVAICILILWSWVLVLFINVGLGLILCYPIPSHNYSELVGLQSGKKTLVYMYGVEYDITDFITSNHGKNAFETTGVSKDRIIEEVNRSNDVTDMFPKPIYQVCEKMTNVNARIPMNKTQDGGENKLTFTHDSGALQRKPGLDSSEEDWIFKTIDRMNRFYKVGIVTYNVTRLVELNKLEGAGYGIINEKVYNLEPYTRFLKSSQVTPANLPTMAFLPKGFHDKFVTSFNPKDNNVDYTKWFVELNLSEREKKSILKCMDQMFYVGMVDFNLQPRCLVTNYLLILSSCIILAVTLVKFGAALQLSGKRTPTDQDKFVICQVPAYTEGEDSIRRTLESLALTEYDDNHKLLFVISDGMLIGSGNDKPTPRIVCDVLGVDPELDPEPLAFQSVAEGSKQLNMGKVFSGIYECEGRKVPYIIVAKVGSSKERSKPGNRGKRDSQIVLLNFLNRVHFDAPMTPLELEIYHQLKNVIGIDPKFYEYILMVDADTEVLPDSLIRLVSTMTRDGNIMGLCGETKLANENQSISTMVQVYEYYISHHLAKAFESLFGSVTCLPGCFSMYRIRTTKGKPLLITKDILDAYSVNLVDTLHQKNLLHLGEDRYLTTLMLKNFPQFTLKFTSDAQCRTVAPDRFEVLLSQRRRWINSTIHNLFELVFLDEMCGVCCLSMRFVVLLDLVGTIILPSTVIYLIYIVFAASLQFQTISREAILLMCSSYMIQALIFLIKQQWQHVGWMFFYLLGTPFFAFYLPIYSYWHFDDFSWGNTRVVVGDGVKQVVTDDDEGFDPDCIPRIKFSEYEQMLWETQSCSTTPSHRQLTNSMGNERGRKTHLEHLPMPYPTIYLQLQPSKSVYNYSSSNTYLSNQQIIYHPPLVHSYVDPNNTQSQHP